MAHSWPNLSSSCRLREMPLCSWALERLWPASKVPQHCGLLRLRTLFRQPRQDSLEPQSTSHVVISRQPSTQMLSETHGLLNMIFTKLWLLPPNADAGLYRSTRVREALHTGRPAPPFPSCGGQHPAVQQCWVTALSRTSLLRSQPHSLATPRSWMPASYFQQMSSVM